MMETVKLLQFRAAYNLPVHAGIEAEIFARHGLGLEIAYTPGSTYISRALKERACDVAHTGADDVIADIENDQRSDLFIFMGLHSGLFSLVGGPDCASIDSLSGKLIGVDARSNGFALVLERMFRAQGFTGDNYRTVEVGGWESRCRALLDRKISATLLTEPFIRNALDAGCHLLAKDFEMIPSYQGTCGAASRRWAERHPEKLVRYIRAYMEATRWCFDRRNRGACLGMLARYGGIDGAGAEHTLNALLDPERGLYADAGVNLSGIKAALGLRAELGYLARPIPPVEKYVDDSYYRKAATG